MGFASIRVKTKQRKADRAGLAIRCTGCGANIKGQTRAGLKAAYQGHRLVFHGER